MPSISSDLRAVLQKGVRAHQAGDLRQAEAAYRQVLGGDANHGEALYLLGVVALQTGYPRQAMELFHKALTRGRRHADLQFHLGIASIQLGQYEDARKALSAAVRLNPLHADALMNLGAVCVELGHGEEGVKYLRRAADLDPGDASNRLNLAVALSKLGRLDEAERELDRITDAASRNEDVRMAYGQLRARQGRREEAAACFHAVLADHPDHVAAHFALGDQLLSLGQTEAAEQHARRAVELEPGNPDHELGLGQALDARNKLDEAVECFRSAGEMGLVYLAEMHLRRGAFDAVRKTLDELRAVNPDSPCLYSLASQINDLPFTETDRRRAEAIADRGNGSRDDIVDLHFALGRSCEAESDFAAAFRHFRRGNEMMAATQPYDRAKEDALVDSTIEAFTPALIERLVRFGDGSEAPVFVVGMPRSGTSLVEQIVASHPLAAGAGELRTMTQIEIDLPAVVAGGRPYPQCAGDIDLESARRLTRRYLDRLMAVAPDAARIVDKMPTNFRRLGLIAVLFPNARIVHCTRDPLDTCLSIFQHRFTGYHPYAHSLSRLGHCYRLYERLMRHWQTVLPSPVHEVRYETVIDEPKEQCRQLLAFLGLEWDDRCLSFHETARPVGTASAWQVRQPLYGTAVRRWKNYDAHLGELKDALAGR